MRPNIQQMARKRPLRKRPLRKRPLGKRHLAKRPLGKRHLAKRPLGKTHLSSTMADNMEKTHNWTIEETRALIEWRAANEARFTGLRNSSATGWEDLISTSGLDISTEQAMKKWNNLKLK
ncbi:unnamed protein product [Gadus morhua 'NCC']